MKLIFVALLSFACCAQGKYVDLTYALTKKIPVYPGRKITFTTEFEGQIPGVGWVASRAFCISEHTSTHMDAPYHYNEHGWTLDKFPLEHFMDLPGVVIDIYDKVHKYADGKLTTVANYALTEKDILDWEAKNGQIPPRALVLLRTGWGERWQNSNEFLGLPEEYRTTENPNADEKNATLAIGSAEALNLNFPGFDAGAALFLTTQRQINGAGIDTLSLDPGNSRTFPAHVIFLKKRVFLLENVANLHALPSKGFTLYAVPFKVDEGTGSPTRLIAKLIDE